MVSMGLRRCRKCNEEKPLTGFSRNKSRADGLCTHCKACMRKAADEWCAKNKERVAEMNARYYQRNAEKHQVKTKAWVEKNQDRRRQITRESAKKNYSSEIACIKAKDRAVKIAGSTPVWADHGIISDMYKLASIYTKAGYKAHVDHIVPLKSKAVCGLHTHDNLTVLPATANISKGNRHWPDMA